MGVVQGISFDSFPRHGGYLGRRVRVCFHYDTRRTIGGVCIRDDAEAPGLTIFRLDNGRVVLATECQYQPEAPAR